MGLWQHFERLAPNLARVLHRDARWMTWNLILAWIPVGLALLLFRRGEGHRRTGVWWVGAGLLALFLPNAPYVFTDLVHLRDDVLLVGHGGSVLSGVLPVYAAFIGAGFVAYYLVLRELGRYLTASGLGAWVAPATLATHAVCAVGVYLGRLARLNSWEPVVQPHDTLQRMVLTLSWRWAPVLVLATFLMTWAGHFVTRAVLEAAWQGTVRLTRQVVGWA
jgi:uncharacterized membrane protein